MVGKRAIAIAILACAMILAALIMPACAPAPGGELNVDYPMPGSVKVTASSPATTSVDASIDVAGEDSVEVAGDVAAGEMLVELTDENGNKLGAYTFDATKGRHEFVSIESKKLNVHVQAKNATGEVSVMSVYVLDGPGTPGS